MPKLKTRKSARNRIKITGSGKMMRRHVQISHLKTKQSSHKKRAKSGMIDVAKSDIKKLSKSLPYR